MSEDKRIRDIEQLKAEAKEGLDCFILLNGGLRSSKHIWYEEESNLFAVTNEIDDTHQEMTPDEIMDQEMTNIGEAMVKGALIKY